MPEPPTPAPVPTVEPVAEQPAPPRLPEPPQPEPIRRKRPIIPTRPIPPGSPDATYIGNRLLYEPGDESVDPLLNLKYIGALVMRAVFFSLVWFLGELVLLLLGGIVTLIAAQDNTLAGIVILGGTLVNLVWSIGLLCAYWLLPVPALVSEWKLTLDGKADAAHDALDHVAAVLRDRDLPIGTIEAKELSLDGQPDRVYLQVREGFFSTLVSSFGFGDDLYIGWTFWIYLSPARWFLHWCSRMLRALKLKSPVMEMNMRFDSARAMREVVHSAVREGADVASGRSPADGHGAVDQLVAADAAAGA
jgi:hypothetical protein